MVDLVSVFEALNHSDICLLLVDHAEFKLVSKSDLENVVIIDTKGIWT
jgi:UDP-N-acetyl-D-mannosaminuronic acid dehydrogenase